MSRAAMMLLAGLLAAAGFAISGCSPAEPTKTVDYYKAHPDERKAKLKECANNPGEKASEPNCVNAEQAEAGSALGDSGIGVRR